MACLGRFSRSGRFSLRPTVDDHGEMRVDAQSWAAMAIETKSDEKEISRSIKVCRIFSVKYPVSIVAFFLSPPFPRQHAERDSTTNEEARGSSERHPVDMAWYALDLLVKLSRTQYVR